MINNTSSALFKTAEIKGLLHKEFILERKSQNLIQSTLVYVLSTIFLCYLSLTNIKGNTWNSLLWIILLFSLTNASYRLFNRERGSQRWYTYTLASAGSIISSKLIYQWIVGTLLSLLVFGVWTLVMRYSVNQYYWFLLVLILGSLSISNVLTLNTALASGTENNATILAILSFPVMLPILLTTIKASELAMRVEFHPDLYLFILVLVALNVLTATLAVILFQYLWRH